MNLFATSTQVQLLLLVILAMLSGSASARFFMLGDLDEPQRETDALLVNTTLFTEFTSLGHDVETLSTTTTDVRGQIKYVLGARLSGKKSPAATQFGIVRIRINFGISIVTHR